LYYKALADGKGGCGFVALVENLVVGFVCGVWNMPYLRWHYLGRYGALMLPWVTLQFLTHPTLLKRLMTRLWIRRSSDVKSQPGYELRPIVVAPSARGSGLAGQLVASLLSDAAARGYESIYLITEQTNIRANAFYQKEKFELVDRFIVDGQPYNRYKRVIGVYDS
jgi:GNAT superfamily N-acetyltransferase